MKKMIMIMMLLFVNVFAMNFQKNVFNQEANQQANQKTALTQEQRDNLVNFLLNDDQTVTFEGLVDYLLQMKNKNQKPQIGFQYEQKKNNTMNYGQQEILNSQSQQNMQNIIQNNEEQNEEQRFSPQQVGDIIIECLKVLNNQTSKLNMNHEKKGTIQDDQNNRQIIQDFLVTPNDTTIPPFIKLMEEKFQQLNPCIRKNTPFTLAVKYIRQLSDCFENDDFSPKEIKVRNSTLFDVLFQRFGDTLKKYFENQKNAKK